MTRARLFIAAAVLVDIPVLVAVITCGIMFGFLDSYDAVMEWRLQHPWSLLPSLAATVLLVRRWSR